MISNSENERLFTFGCSFTNWIWPTWANILGKEFEYFENWARPGSGNQYIFNSLLECCQRHTFTKKDHIIIMWSGIDREDRYVENMGGWIGNGSVFNYDLYPKQWVKQFSCHRGYLIRDLATILAAKTLLDQWKVNYSFLSVFPIIPETDEQDVYDLYLPAIDNFIPSVDEIVYQGNFTRKREDFHIKIKNKDIKQFQLANLKDLYIKCAGTDWPSFDYFYKKKPIERAIIDDISKFGLYDKLQNLINANDVTHPSPEEHLYYIQKVLPNYTISSDTVEWVYQYQIEDSFNKHLPNRL